MLPHLTSGWAVDQAILTEQDRVVIIRFGHDNNYNCMLIDEILFKISEKIKNFGVIYLVDITQVPDFNAMYELYDDLSVMFFYRNRHIMVDLGTGKLNIIIFSIFNIFHILFLLFIFNSIILIILFSFSFFLR